MIKENHQGWHNSKFGISTGKGFEYFGKGCEYIGTGIKYGLIILALAYGGRSCSMEDYRQREIKLNAQRTTEEYRTRTIDNLLQKFDQMSPDEFKQLCIELDLAKPPLTQQETNQ